MRVLEAVRARRIHAQGARLRLPPSPCRRLSAHAMNVAGAAGARPDEPEMMEGRGGGWPVGRAEGKEKKKTKETDGRDPPGEHGGERGTGQKKQDPRCAPPPCAPPGDLSASGGELPGHSLFPDAGTLLRRAGGALPGLSVSPFRQRCSIARDARRPRGCGPARKEQQPGRRAAGRLSSTDWRISSSTARALRTADAWASCPRWAPSTLAT